MSLDKGGLVSSMDVGGDVALALLNYEGVFWFNTEWDVSNFIAAAVGGTGSISWGGQFVLLRSGVTTGSSAYITKRIKLPVPVEWSKKRSFYAAVTFLNITDVIAHIVSGYINDPTVSANAESHIGFKLVDNALYGTVADDVAESTLALGTVTDDQEVLLKAVKNASGVVEFYVDGVYKGQITTNVPGADSGYDDYLFMASVSNTNGSNKDLRVVEIRVVQEPE